MKNSNIVPATTNTTLKTSKMSFADRLAMGEDIDNIVSDDETPTTDATAETPTNDESTIETIETPLQRAEKVTQKSRLKSIFEDYQIREIPKEEWVRKATNDYPEFLKERIAKEFRYFNGAERPASNSNGTIINRTSLTVEQATEKAAQMRRETIERALQMIKDAKERGAALIERAKESEAKKAEQDEKIAAQSVKKAGEVLKSLESIDTSKVELTPEMRAMMLKMLGMEAV